MTDFPDWQAPQAHATAINTTGVPLIRNITVISDTAVINAGTTSSPVTVTMPQFAEGYLLEVIPQNPGSRIFAADVVITHVDASNNPLAVEQVTVSNWQNLGNDTSVIRGRLLGTSIQVQAQVAASAWINTVTGSGVTADNIKIRSCALYTYVPGTGKRVPIIASADGLLCNGSASTPLGAVAGVVTLQQVLPDYTGAVQVSSSTVTGGGFTYSCQIDSYTVSNGTGGLSTIRFAQVNSTTPLNQQFSLPSCFNLAKLVQNSTVSASAGMAITILSPDQ